jgi:multisubunit Na+/H+ antiporter MnhE subunit
MSRFLLSVVVLVAIYTLVLASLHPWDIVFGAVVAGGLLWGSRRFVFGPESRPVSRIPTHILGFFPFAVAVLVDIIRGTWSVVLTVLGLRRLDHPGIVMIPIGDRTPLGVTVSSLVTTLSPGAFLVDVDWDANVILLHVLDASDPDAVRDAHEQLYQRYQRRVFP